MAMVYPFERPFQHQISTFLSNKGGMIIDIGAHTGDTTVMSPVRI